MNQLLTKLLSSKIVLSALALACVFVNICTFANDALPPGN